MRLDQSTWLEVKALIERGAGIILPTGSTEQHGPMGLIGTDSICAEKIAEAAAEQLDCLVAPTLAYSPAPFNMAFPGTVSISSETFQVLFREVVSCLQLHGFKLIYVLNAHGANLEPLRGVAAEFDASFVRIRSWWEFGTVEQLRQQYYGDWEGMHATPSEIAITQATHRIVPPGEAIKAPKKLSKEYIKEHAGDRHGPPEEHRHEFPDGRVGSHSALACPEHGKELLEVAAKAVAEDFRTEMSQIR
ncbi:MAG: creatininase family protein [Rhizobiaceae bacterium]